MKKIEVILEGLAEDEIVTNPTDITITFSDDELLHFYDLSDFEADGIEETDERFAEFKKVIEENYVNTGNLYLDVYALYTKVYTYYYTKYKNEYIIDSQIVFG